LALVTTIRHHEDDDFDAADEGLAEVDPEESERLFLEACAKAAEAGL
jgi:hypothetical protein